MAAEILAALGREQSVFKHGVVGAFDEHFYKPAYQPGDQPLFSYFGPESTRTVEKTPMYGVAAPQKPNDATIRAMLLAASKRLAPPLLLDGLDRGSVESAQRIAKEMGIKVNTRPVLGKALVGSPTPSP